MKILMILLKTQSLKLISYNSLTKQDRRQIFNNFIRLSSILVGNVVPEYDEVWKLLLSSTKIVEIILSLLYSVGEKLVLRGMVEEFLANYLQIKSKQHLSQKLILEVGSSLNRSTIRFEAKHNFLLTFIIEAITQSI